MTQGLPTSGQLATMLLEAAETAERLQAEYWAAWNAARTARVNRDLTRDNVSAAAYASSLIDGKNEAVRAVQLANILNENWPLTAVEETLHAADSDVKQIEGLLEVARTHRSALHDLVSLRVAELGVQAATGRRAIAQVSDWHNKH